MVSTFFAEVISGSTPFAFFTPVGWLVVFPIYLLHILFLGSIVFRYGRPVIYVLYPAGMLFGMYETYITKVIWGSADWAHGTASVGGIYIFPFLLLVLFFHSFISFILSLTVSEVLLTSSRDILSYMPSRVRRIVSEEPLFRRSLLFGALCLGLLWVASTPWTVTLLSEVSGMAVIIISISLWRGLLHGNRHGIAELLPKRRGMVITGMLLLFVYLLFGAYMNSRYMPGPSTQFLTWLIYLLLFFILYRNLRISCNQEKKKVRLPDIDRRFLLLLISVFLLSSALKVAFGLGTILFVFLSLSMSILGIYLFLEAMLKAFGIWITS